MAEANQKTSIKESTMNRTSQDVQGFIEKRECKLTGYWKVYSDVNSAKDKFEKYSKCFRIYLEQLEKERPA